MLSAGSSLSRSAISLSRSFTASALAVSHKYLRRAASLIFFLGLFLLPLKSQASVAFVQTKACSGSGTSVTCAYTASVAAGDLLVANVDPANTTATPYTISVSDNENGAWTQNTQCFSAYNNQADFFYLPNSAAGSVTVTVTSSASSSHFGVAIAEYSGIATSNPMDVNGTCSPESYVKTITAPSVTTTNANDLVLNLLSTNGTTGAVTATSPYTLRNTNVGTAFADQIVSSAGTYTGTTFNWVYNNGAFAIAAALKAGGSATPVLLPNIGVKGDYALAAPSPQLAFGDQGARTSSPALPISISNCSNAQYASMFGICGGSGSLTVTSMAITGPDALDFVLTGTCGTISSGSDCEPTITFTPTAASGTNETATLIVNYAGGLAAQTMSLTGTSATVTSLSTSACPTALSANTNYQLTANIACGGTAFTISGANVDFNLNGHTVTYNNSTSNQLATVTAYSTSGGTVTLTVNTMASPFTAGQLVAFNFPTISNPLSYMNGLQYTVLASPAPTATSFAVTETNVSGSGSVSGAVSPDIQTDAFEVNAFNVGGFMLHNGTVTSGAGQNVFSRSSRSGIVQTLFGYGFSSMSVFNTKLNINQQFEVAINSPGANTGAGVTIHDNIINNTAVGSCARVACRDSYQSTSVTISGSISVNAYNNIFNGGPQGGIQSASPGTIEYNSINPGNAAGGNTNDFGIYTQGLGLLVTNNAIMVPFTSNSSSRGVLISGVATGAAAGAIVSDNLIQVIELPVNHEYGGCEGAGTYGIQFDDAPTSATSSGNNIVATAIACPANGLRLTKTETPTNASNGNTYTAIRGAGAVTCNQPVFQPLAPGCAWGVSIDGSIGFTSTGDTFAGDSGAVLFDTAGTTGITFYSSTLTKPATAVGFHTFTAINGSTAVGGGPVNIHFVDPVYTGGAGPTDTNIPYPVPGTPTQNMGSVSIFPADWTQTMTVMKASGGAAIGATVMFTDALSNTYNCTTVVGGVCSVAVPQYRDNNDSAANCVENRNPYSLSVTMSGCTTNTQSGLTISATTSRSITLSGC